MKKLQENLITLADERRLSFSEGGDPDGYPVIYCHGFPGSKFEIAFLEKACRENGIRLIAADRPGYGLSDFKTQRKLSDWPSDVESLTSSLGITSFAVIGMSGGAPYALATAASFGDRVTALSLISGLGECFGKPALKSMHGLGRFMFWAAGKYPDFMRKAFSVFARFTFRRHPFLVTLAIAPGAPRSDREALAKKEVRQILLRSFETAFLQGTAAVTEDLLIYGAPWGIKIEEIKAPTHLWHGALDPAVPDSYARASASCIPNSTLHIVEGEGHFSLCYNHAEEIIKTFKASLQPSQSTPMKLTSSSVSSASSVLKN